MANNPLLQSLVAPPMPEPISWLPQTLGWKVLAVLLLLVALQQSIQAAVRWRQLRYRREAMAKIRFLQHSLTDNNRVASIKALNRVLKETAVFSFGDKTVASLQREHWLQFLNQSGAEKLDETLGDAWQIALYVPEERVALDDKQCRLLLEFALVWVATHKVNDEH